MPVPALFGKVGVVAQVLHRLMFNNEQTAGQQQVFIKYYFGYFGYAAQVVRRVGKYKVVLVGLYFEVFKNIGLKCFYLCKAMLAGGIFKVVNAMYAAVNGRYALGIARCKFERQVTRAAKQVEHFYTLQFYLVLQNVKQGFLGQIGSGPNGQVFGCIKAQAF